MTQRHIFVPEGVAERHRIDALELGLTEKLDVEIDGLICPGYLLAAGEQATELALARLKVSLVAEEYAIAGDRLHEVALGKCDSYIKYSDNHPAAEKIDALSGELMNLLERFGTRLGLLEVGLHFIDQAEFFEPPPQRRGCLTVVIGGGPIGAMALQDVSVLCGVKLTEDDETIPLRAHTLGYGGVIKDDAGTLLAQIVGSTWYLTLPSREERFVTLYHTGSANLLWKALRLTSNKRAEATQVERVELADAEAYVEHSRAFDDRAHKHLGEMIDLTRKEIDQLEDQIRLKIRFLRDFAPLVELNKARLASPNYTEEMREGFVRLKAHPLVERLAMAEGEVLEVWTKPITITHDGARYPLGAYVLSIRTSNVVFIRSCGYPQNGTHMHPHIPATTGSPCLGNATRAINDALNSDDRAYGIELLLDWLANGYDHGIAAQKITEWPRENEAVERKEAAHAA